MVPMLRAACAAGRGEGWEVELILSEIARERPWLELFASDAGCPCTSRRSDAARRGAGGDRGAPRADQRARDPAFPLLVVRRPDGACRRRPPPDRAVVAPPQPPVTRAPRPPAEHGTLLRLRAPGARDPLRAAASGARGARSARAAGPRHRLPERDRHQPIPTRHRRGAGRAREQLGLPPDARVVVHLGWDWHRKGGDLFLGRRRPAGAPRRPHPPHCSGAATSAAGRSPPRAERPRARGPARRRRRLPLRRRRRARQP